MDASFGVVTFERDSCDALEVAVYRRVDTPFPYAVVEDDLQAHSIRKRRYDDAAYHGASRQTPAVDAKLTQPAPPRGQRLEALEHGPYLLRSCRERERARVVDDVSRVGRLGHCHEIGEGDTRRLAAVTRSRIPIETPKDGSTRDGFRCSG